MAEIRIIRCGHCQFAEAVKVGLHRRTATVHFRSVIRIFRFVIAFSEAHTSESMSPNSNSDQKNWVKQL